MFNPFNFLTGSSAESQQERSTGDAEEFREEDYKDDAYTVSAILDDLFQPDSVIHLGCGIGLHLEQFHSEHIDVKGVDPSPIAHERAAIPEEYIEIASFENTYTPDKDYDLVLCFDVLAHTPDRLKGSLINSIVSAGTTIVFSPVTTEQASFREHDTDHWIAQLEQAGLTYDDDTTQQLQNTLQIHDVQWGPHEPLVFHRQ